jgi:hypothetical protein
VVTFILFIFSVRRYSRWLHLFYLFLAISGFKNVVINNDRTEARLSSSTASQNMKDLVDHVTSRVIILMIWKIRPHKVQLTVT